MEILLFCIICFFFVTEETPFFFLSFGTSQTRIKLWFFQYFSIKKAPISYGRFQKIAYFKVESSLNSLFFSIGEGFSVSNPEG